MPPKPKALIAARRGRSDFVCHGSGWRSTRNGLDARSTPLAACAKLAVGGSVFSRNASKTLSRPAEPAAVNVCPTFDLTEPMTHCPDFQELSPQSVRRL